ncbi:MAG TPA: DNA mismatch repair protein, partial [Pirellula sp.]|nr:DNA mismatch repair protein [Pirellula sp.]
LAVVGVAHPLLKDSSQVPNSVTITSDRPLLLVTGSNMAGKSTLLRSIGVNSILSRLGAPVCAVSWTGEVCELASSIRVQDSLQDGVSFFMAELKRLRAVVDLAQRENHPDGKQMLVLLDEILQGTNSRERQIAVEHVLDKLVACGCIVLSSTHDLELAGNEEIQKIAQVVHFREHFEEVKGEQVMRFDYLMRPGVTPTTNALKLLEMVGLRRI